MLYLLVNNLSANKLLVCSSSFHQNHVIGDLPGIKGLQKSVYIGVSLILLFSVAVLKSAV